MYIQRTRKMPSTRSLVVLLVCYLSFSQNIQNSIVAAARPRNSIQLATGEWEVSIRGGLWKNPSSIFPQVEPLIDGVIPFVQKRFLGSSMDCILSMASDGTFVLTPKYVTRQDSTTREEYKTANHDWKMQTTNEQNPLLLDLRGSWNVLANPYCVTDRFYDQLSLCSYPRQQTTKESSSSNFEHVVSQSPFQLVLNCRMWGRHKRQLKNKETYRMTHGTLVCKDQDLPWWKHFGRPIVGSFSAVRSSHRPKHRGWIDRNELGYSTD